MDHVRTSPYYPQSNGKLERWHKPEVRMHSPEDAARSRRGPAMVSDYVDDYNQHRLHGAIGYIAPADKLAGKASEILANRECKLAEAGNDAQKIGGDNRNNHSLVGNKVVS
ncbi:MAG: integrase core domain-containing protein [Candidatus Competibacteraceae bacterium]